MHLPTLASVAGGFGDGDGGAVGVDCSKAALQSELFSLVRSMMSRFGFPGVLGQVMMALGLLEQKYPDYAQQLQSIKDWYLDDDRPDTSGALRADVLKKVKQLRNSLRADRSHRSRARSRGNSNSN